MNFFLRKGGNCVVVLRCCFCDFCIDKNIKFISPLFLNQGLERTESPRVCSRARNSSAEAEKNFRWSQILCLLFPWLGRLIKKKMLIHVSRKVRWKRFFYCTHNKGLLFSIYKYSLNHCHFGDCQFYLSSLYQLEVMVSPFRLYVAARKIVRRQPWDSSTIWPCFWRWKQTNKQNIHYRRFGLYWVGRFVFPEYCFIFFLITWIKVHSTPTLKLSAKHIWHTQS